MKWMRLLTLILALLLITGCAGDPSAFGHEDTTDHSGATLSASVTENTEQTVPTAPLATQPPTAPLATQPPTEPTITQPPAEPEDTDFVRLADYIPHLRTHLPYATTENFTGQVIYDFQEAYLRYGTAKRLRQAALELEKLGYGILIWDGYRPLYAQQRLWDACPDPTYVSKPGTGNRRHCRGMAVDVTLYELDTGEQLLMPTDFDNFSELADRDYTDCPPEAARNAQILEDAMLRAGFAPYKKEWWHFNDTTNYPIEENFHPPYSD